MRLTGFLSVSMLVILGLSACATTDPVAETRTENLISISYDSYQLTPTLSPLAINMAIEHCKAQGGLFANYRGANIPNPFSAKEVHTFVCERSKTDDSAVILAQNRIYADQIQASANAFNASIALQPTRTTCNTFGYQTTCTTY